MRITKGDLKTVGIVTVGVMLAGFLMFTFRDVDAVDKAISGFGG